MTAEHRPPCRPARGTPSGRVVWVLLLAFLLGAPPIGAQDEAPVAGDPSPAALPEAVLEARRQLAEDDLDVAVLAIHAKTLLDAGDLDGLRQVLQDGGENAVLGVLQALQATVHDGLLPELLSLAARSSRPEVTRLAGLDLARLVAARPAVRAALVGHLREGDLPPEELAVVVDVLGGSRDLSAVPALIDELDGSRADAAARALRRLTGHRAPDPSAAARAAWWRGFWSNASDLPRDVLLEQALETERAETDQRLAAMRAEVVQSRLAEIGQNVDRLTAALADEYAEVRLTAAQRLGGHPELERAASASVPVLLARLGYGGEAGSAGTDGDGEAPVETDATVRVALVRALGVLGRDDPEVQAVLLDVLGSGHGVEARAAVDALERVHDQPDVVAPLLRFLQSGDLDEDTIVTVLGVVARNQPVGVLDELLPWVQAGHGPRVRAAAVGAAIASADVMPALESVASLAAVDESRDVRYALTASMGDRVRELPADDPGRAPIVDLLGQLLDDRDPSVRAEAAASLGASGEQAALPLLEARAQAETDPSVMQRLVAALGELGLMDGLPVIGRACASWSGEGAPALQDAARRALTEIGDDAPSDTWLDMGLELHDVGAFGLAEVCLREAIRRGEGAPDARETVSRARGQLAEVLWLEGKAADARDLLTQLNAAQAPYPPPGVRLDLLARACEQLDLPGEAADWYLARLALLSEGDRTHLDTRRDAARALIAAGRWDEALPHVQILVDADGSDNELLFWLARCQRGTGATELARQSFDRLLERIPAEDTDFRAQVEAERAALPPAAAPADGATPSAEAADEGTPATGGGGDGR